MEYSSNVGVSVFTQTYVKATDVTLVYFQLRVMDAMEETQMITDIRRFYEEKINDTGM